MDSHSTEVHMYLRYGAKTVSLSRLTPTLVVLRDLADVPRGPAELVVVIDGVSRSRPVNVISSKRRAARIGAKK